MIHYAGYEAKPWVNRSAYLGDYYFYYLRRTFWYEQVLGLREPGALQASAQGAPGGVRGKLRRALRRLWRRLPWYVRRVANPAAYSIQRRLMGE